MQSPARPVPAAAPWASDWLTTGITGTNGKTSTATMLSAILTAADKPVFTVTTLGFFFRQLPIPSSTTWNGFMAAGEQASAEGCRHGVVELTSQALARGHAQRFRFDIGVFTNLSRDHLNLHGSPEAYLAAKAQLFVFLGPGQTAVLNARDPAADLLDRAIPNDVKRLWYGAPHRGPAHHQEQLAARAIELSPTRTTVLLEDSPLARCLDGKLEVPLIGEVFGENALAAALAAYAMGIDPLAIRHGLATTPAVPGRFEIVGQHPLVAIDYAHCPRALQHTCGTARALCGPAGQTWIVFGAGGDTDPSKREPMGMAVGQAADHAIVTNDNPRNEHPQTIADTLSRACREAGCRHVTTILDRAVAIDHALTHAGPNDVVVIAGKGHETGQIIAGQTLPFSDRETVQQWLAQHAPG